MWKIFIGIVSVLILAGCVSNGDGRADREASAAGTPSDTPRQPSIIERQEHNRSQRLASPGRRIVPPR